MPQMRKPNNMYILTEVHNLLLYAKPITNPAPSNVLYAAKAASVSVKRTPYNAAGETGMIF